jgi:thymidylate synthase (FAD)
VSDKPGVDWYWRHSSDVKLIGSHGSDKTIVSAARVSYNSSSKGEDKDRKLIRYLLTNHHTSPFEHVTFTVRASVPLFVARQWMRHRTWSYNEVSYRYTQPEMEFYRPTEYRKQSTSNKQMSEGVISDEKIARRLNEGYTRAVVEAVETYQDMIDEGVSRELARMVLPTSLFTHFYASVDLHNLLKFLELRLHEHAQPEIQEVAAKLLDIVRPLVPWTVEIWEELQSGKTN